MPNYRLNIKTSAKKAIDALDNVWAERVMRKIEALAEIPRPAGVKKLKGFKDSWRIRVGDYRVIYIIVDATITIEVVRVAHRKEVYD